MGDLVMHKHLVIIGAGGHGQATADLALSSGIFEKISFVDDCFPQNTKALNLDVIGNTDSFFTGDFEFDSCIVAIGNNSVRKKLVEKISAYSLPLVSLIHPKAFVSDYAKIAPGVVVMAGSVVGTNAKLGLGVLVNANSTIDHDCLLDEFAHIGVGVSLAGGVKVGKGAWLQAGCSAGYFIEVADGANFQAGTSLRV
jgi:sugar O-acyltransferase (sialic acid O-acetyltransferase NeuD family)